MSTISPGCGSSSSAARGGLCERRGKSCLTRRRRGGEGGGGGSFIEVAAGSQRPELQDRLGSNQAPACAGQLHPVADPAPARPFADAGGDGIARREVAVVVQIRRVLQQVVGARIDRLACIAREAGDGRRTPHRRRHFAGLALENAPHARPGPARQLGAPLAMEPMRRFRDVLGHVDDVEHHRDVHAVGGGARFHQVELRLGAIDERDPALDVLGVLALGFQRRLRDHLPRLPFEARPRPVSPRGEAATTTRRARRRGRPGTPPRWRAEADGKKAGSHNPPRSPDGARDGRRPAQRAEVDAPYDRHHGEAVLGQPSMTVIMPRIAAQPRHHRSTARSRRLCRPAREPITPLPVVGQDPHE